MYDIVILTDHRYVKPKEVDWYVKQVLDEDEILLSSLKKKGLNVCKKDWADSEFDWTKTRYAIFRTTWDYFQKFNQFLNWIEITKNKTTFINSAEIIKWNIDKHYLKDLLEDGINIAPTLFIEKTDKTSLIRLFKSTNWKEAVIKPAVSGAARHTYRINLKNYHQYESVFQQLIKEECMLFQKYLPNITKMGEISLVMIGGKYTHAVKKIAKKGDFRVQDDHGGTVEEYHASSKEIEFAELCLEKCAYNPIYARVDIVYDDSNQVSLSELELIEPELWFRKNPESANLLADEIYNFI